MKGLNSKENMIKGRNSLGSPSSPVKKKSESPSPTLHSHSSHRHSHEPASDFTLMALRTSQQSNPNPNALKLDFSALQELYGRTQQQAQLKEAFQRVCEAEAVVEMVLVDGVSGVGKTALVDDFHKTLVGTSNAYFVSGHYVQSNAQSVAEPFSALKVAFGQLIGKISEHESELQEIKRALAESLGSQLKSLTKIIPSLRRILKDEEETEGNIPTETSAETSSENKNKNCTLTQLALVFLRLLRAVCRPSHPVVLFLDDLQWADEESLDFVASLLAEEHCQNFMFIGAFRSDEYTQQKARSDSYSSLSFKDLSQRRQSKHNLTHFSQTRFSAGNSRYSSRHLETTKSSPNSTSIRNLFRRVASSRFSNQNVASTGNRNALSSRNTFRRQGVSRWTLFQRAEDISKEPDLSRPPQRDFSRQPPPRSRSVDESSPPNTTFGKRNSQGRPSRASSSSGDGASAYSTSRGRRSKQEHFSRASSSSREGSSAYSTGRSSRQERPSRASTISADGLALSQTTDRQELPLRDGSPDLVTSRSRNIYKSEPMTMKYTVRRKPKMTDLELKNLDVESVNKMVSIVTGMNMENSKTLASVVARKTLGNAYSVLQFLEMIAKTGLLRFSFRIFQWEWDVDRLNRETTVTANVGELLAGRIKNLSNQSQSFLILAASIGISFSGDILHKLAFEEMMLGATLKPSADISTADLLVMYKEKQDRALQEAVKSGLITDKGGGLFTFPHDLVHTNLVKMTPPQSRALVHLGIGRIMRYHELFEDEARFRFATTSHLNEGAFHIEDEQERLDLIALNLRASIEAKMALSFHSAAEFLEKAIIITHHTQDWDSKYSLILEVYTAAAEVQFTCGKLERSVALAEEVIDHAVCLKDKIRAHYIIVDILGVQRRFSEALDEGYMVLDMLGCIIPRKHTRVHLAVDLMRIKRLMSSRSSGDLLSMQPMTDDMQVYTLRILDSLSLITWMASEDSLLSILITRMMLITLRHGTSIYAPFAFATYGMLLSHMGDIKGAYTFGNLGLQLADKLRSRVSLTRTALIVYTFTNHLRNPLLQSVEPMLNAHRIGLQVGEVEYSSMCLSQYSSLYIAMGLPLAPYVQDMKEFCEQLELHNQDQCVALIVPYWQLALNLMGKSEDPLFLQGEAMDQYSFSEDENEEDQEAGASVINLRFVLLLLAYIFQEHDLLETRWKDEHGKKGVITGTHFINYLDVLFSGLAAFSLFRSTKKKKYFAEARRATAVMKRLVKRCGINCHAMYMLLLAERESFKGNVERSRKTYDHAISNLARIGLIHLEAIALERAGDSMHRFGDSYWPRIYQSRARLRYMEWGAMTKADKLAEEQNLDIQAGSLARNTASIAVRGRRRYDPSTWSTINEHSAQ